MLHVEGQERFTRWCNITSERTEILRYTYLET